MTCVKVKLMRAALPPFPILSFGIDRSGMDRSINTGIDKLRSHRIELALIGSMVTGICLVSGAAFSVLTNPNLGQTLTPVSLLKPGAIQKKSISTMGDALLELSKPLRIEVVSTPSPSQTSTALTIVSPAEFQPQLLQQTHEKGIRLLLITLIAGGGLSIAARLAPSLPIWPQRRRPLGERLDKSAVSTHPLSVKQASIPRSPRPNNKRKLSKLRPKRAVPMSAIDGAALASVVTPFGNLKTVTPSSPKRVVMTAHVGLASAQVRASQRTTQPSHNSGTTVIPTLANSVIPPANSMAHSVSPTQSSSPAWLNELDMRQQAPIGSLL